MMQKRLATLFACILVTAAITANTTVLCAPAADPLVGAPIDWPPPAISTESTVLANDSIVKITDAKLKAALLSITKVAAGKPIHLSDLAKLAGGLDLSGKGIANADGLQYCVNLTALNLSNNKLESLPTKFKDMNKLETLSLEKNKLTKFPDVLGSMVSLSTLSLKGNSISKLPTDINVVLAAVKYLDVSNNKIATVPTNIGKMAALDTLYLAGNGIKTLPFDLFKAAKLVNLDLSGNMLETLPKEVGTAPSLANLDISNNIIDTLPAGIGSAPALVKLIARSNRLTAIEPSLCTGKIKTLLLGINRISALPQELSGKAFDQIGVEWNYIDMSEGSANRKIMEAVTAVASTYLHQLPAVKVSNTSATPTTVSLKWDPIPDGADGELSWKVSKYYVYNAGSTTWKKYAELDSMATQYVITGLTPDKELKLMVGVEYDLTLPDFKGSTSFFTEADVATLKKDAPTPVVSATPAVLEPTAAPSATAEPTAAATSKAVNTPSSGGSGSGLVAALVVVSVVAVAAVAFAVFLILKARKKSQYKY